MRIRECRVAANISQESLAESVGVIQAAVSQWERGITFPKAELLPKIAAVLGCTIDDLFADGKKETPA